MSIKENLPVYLAAAVGLGPPGLNSVLDIVNPVLQALFTVGQLGVAIITIIYIYSKWKTVGKKSRRSRKGSKDEAP